MYEFSNDQFNAFFHVEFYYGLIYGMMLGVVIATLAMMNIVTKNSKKEAETTVIALPAPEEPETQEGEKE